MGNPLPVRGRRGLLPAGSGRGSPPARAGPARVFPARVISTRSVPASRKNRIFPYSSQPRISHERPEDSGTRPRPAIAVLNWATISAASSLSRLGPAHSDNRSPAGEVCDDQIANAAMVPLPAYDKAALPGNRQRPVLCLEGLRFAVHGSPPAHSSGASART
jgi:hypothetical protein